MQTYEEFIAKFDREQPKTTDDCYTPEAVWNVILKFVQDRYGIPAEDIVRPFYPGGDFENVDYTGKIVVDNPPFSIMKKIVKFYIDNDIKFFLFCSTLTPPLYDFAFGKISLVIGNGITYENGAQVNTSFVTNLETTGIVSDTKFLHDIKAAQPKQKRKQEKPYNYMLLPEMQVLTRCGLGMNVPWDEIQRIASKIPGGKQTYGKCIVLEEKAGREYEKRRKFYEERKQNSI